MTKKKLCPCGIGPPTHAHNQPEPPKWAVKKAQELFNVDETATIVLAEALGEAHARGRNEGLEEAAKAVDWWGGTDENPGDVVRKLKGA